MVEDLAGLVIGGIGLFAAGGACYWVRRDHLVGQLTVNEAIGLRTKRTKRSHSAWVAGHDAAAPWLLVATWIAVIFAVVVGFLTALGSDASRTAAIVTMLAGYLGILCAALVGTHYANSAAKLVNRK